MYLSFDRPHYSLITVEAPWLVVVSLLNHRYAHLASSQRLSTYELERIDSFCALYSTTID